MERMLRTKMIMEGKGLNQAAVSLEFLFQCCYQPLEHLGAIRTSLDAPVSRPAESNILSRFHEVLRVGNGHRRNPYQFDDGFPSPAPR